MQTRKIVIALFMGIVPFLTGCSTMSNTGKGALVGGGLGAGGGALLAKATGGKATTGAVIGGAAGALLGGVVGNDMDQQEKKQLEGKVRQAEDRQAYADSQQAQIDEIISMKQAGRSDELIMNHIRTSRATFQLTSADISRLSEGGVPDRVIMEMQNHRPVAVRPAHIHRPVMLVPAPPPPIYVVQPPPPPPGFHVGVRVP